MTLYFITGNKNKFREVKEILPQVEQLELDLTEIQELDSKKVIEEKLKEAQKLHKGEFICEDTSLRFDCLNGLPGPLIKWFLQSLGIDGLSTLAAKYRDQSATAVTIFGYTDGKNIKFFEGTLKGKIVSPRGQTSFGWDPIFLPESHDKTLAEMTLEEKNQISMRQEAARKLKDYLNSSGK